MWQRPKGEGRKLVDILGRHTHEDGGGFDIYVRHDVVSCDFYRLFPSSRHIKSLPPSPRFHRIGIYKQLKQAAGCSLANL